MFEQSIDTFIPFVQDHRFWGYTILFLAMVVEGEVFLIVSGMLAHLHALDFGDILWVAFLGVTIGDVFWYGFGILLSRKKSLAFLARTAEKTVLVLLPRFREKPFHSIFLSKFIYGANHATLLISGFLRVQFSLFIKAEMMASCIWISLYSVAGFMFGHVALAVTKKISRLALLAAVFVIGFILLERWASKYYEQRELEEFGKQEENNHNA